jgi:2-keto-4-pentenoate hydratase/2-oxohepta-3-ene-1,7-dioic acid hydratase in catechol pathway
MHCPRIFCIGRNYVAHAEELKTHYNRTVVFMKPRFDVDWCW